MGEHTDVLIDAALEAFGLENPVYQFGYCGGGDLIEAAGTGDGSVETGCSGGGLEKEGQAKRLEDLDRLPFPDGAARTVICAGALEYVFEPRRAADEMIRILAPGGILLLAASPDGFESEPPDHYWHFTPNSVGRLLGGLEATLIGWQGADRFPHTLFGIGCKPPATERFLRGAGAFMDCVGRQLDEAAAGATWWPKLKNRLAGWVQSSAQRRCRQDRRKVRFVVHLPVGRQFKYQLSDDHLLDNRTGTRLDLEN